MSNLIFYYGLYYILVMCDRIKDDDYRMKDIKEILTKSKCYEENERLNTCMKSNHRDWRLCKV